MVKELCFRCKRPVYPTDKVGPLKDSTFFHHGCFKCYICGTRLALKTYCHNRSNTEDQEVYCSNHVPNPNPHDPIPHRSNLLPGQTGNSPKHDGTGGGGGGGGGNGGNGAQNGNGLGVTTGQQNNVQQNGNGQTNGHSQNGNGAAGAPMVGDIKIQHALRATEIQKPYPKITHAGARYELDYDTQTRLELVHRKQEDDLYQQLQLQRDEEERRFSQTTKEEWEEALKELSRKYERESSKGVKAREELIKVLTLKRDKQRETLHQRLREKERTMTADLIDQQSREMLDLFRQARQSEKTVKKTNSGTNGTSGGPHGMNGGPNGVNGATHGMNGGSNGYNGHSGHNGHNGHNGYHNGYNNGVNGMNGMNGMSGMNGMNGTNGVVNGSHSINGTNENGGDLGSLPSSGGYPSTPPPPFPPIGRKRTIYLDASIFETIDQTAISIAQSEQHSFTDLVMKLTHHCRSDMEKARAIYRWITVKNLNLMDFDHRIDPNTPMGILRGIKYGTESYHVLFKRLCSYAGLHCVVIKGYSKSAGYQPGMKFEDGRFRNTWNAVFLDGSWRFVQCNWGARHLVNARDAAYPGSRGGAGHSESLRYEYDDHYFMTDPEEFIYEFYPSQPEWQLLKRPLSLAEFEELPFVRSLFFRYELSFADVHLRAVVYADKSGAATVAIRIPPDAISNLIFHYNLRFYQSEESEFNGVSLKRFVMQSVVDQSGNQSSTSHSVVFRVHTPSRGEFLLDVFANHVSTGEYLTGQPMKFKSVSKFKVVCEHLNVIMVPLPECASGEWGPVKAYRLFGLIAVDNFDAIVNAGRELEIRFRMTKPLAEFVTALHRNNADDRRLSKLVSHSVRGDTVLFRVQFAEEGQYGLDIYTRESSASLQQSGHSARHHSGDRQLLTHCCKYLINARF